MPRSAEGNIRLEGDLSIRDAADLTMRLREGLDRGALTVGTDRLQSIDAAGLQVLVAAHATARARGASLRVEAPAGRALAHALARSGIADAPDLPLAWDGDVWTGFVLQEDAR